MKRAALTLTLLVFTNACGVPASHNTYNGKSENYVCIQSNGGVELKLSESPLPNCTRLADLPPEDAEVVVEAAQNNKILPPGTILIDRSGI